ncbi:hypothetical protein ACFE04_004590 [Oxalis oulophora]
MAFANRARSSLPLITRALIRSSTEPLAAATQGRHTLHRNLTRSPQLLRNFATPSLAEQEHTKTPQEGKNLHSIKGSGNNFNLPQKILGAAAIPVIVIFNKVSSTFLLNLTLFWHIKCGINEIIADYVHDERSLTWLKLYFNLLFIIAASDVFRMIH